MGEKGIKYCVQCGSLYQRQTPIGDDRARWVCSSCGHIFYENPKMVVGCIPVRGDKILLCKRAIEPRKGYWTLPCGYMEEGETLEEGALRETREEAGAEVAIQKLYAAYSLPQVNQVYFLFLSELLKDGYALDEETEEVMYFAKYEIPWNELAFAAVRFALEAYVDDKNPTNSRLLVGSKS